MSDFSERKKFWDKFNAIKSEIEGLKPEGEIITDHCRDSFTAEHKNLLRLVYESRNLPLDDEDKEILHKNLINKVCDAAYAFGAFAEATLEYRGSKGINSIAEVYAQAAVDAELSLGTTLEDEDDYQQRQIEETGKSFTIIFQAFGENNERAAEGMTVVYCTLADQIYNSVDPWE